MWRGRCSLPVLPASSDRPAVGHNCHLPLDHTACQPDWRPAGWVLHYSLSLQQKSYKRLCFTVITVYNDDDDWCLLMAKITVSLHIFKAILRTDYGSGVYLMCIL